MILGNFAWNVEMWGFKAIHRVGEVFDLVLNIYASTDIRSTPDWISVIQIPVNQCCYRPIILRCQQDGPLISSS
jgi:hypothetical protein